MDALIEKIGEDQWELWYSQCRSTEVITIYDDAIASLDLILSVADSMICTFLLVHL